MKTYLNFFVMLAFAQADNIHDLNDSETRADFSENGTYVNEGDSVQMMVESNPTTGYEWIVDNDACAGVISIAQEYLMDDAEDENGEMMAGVGGNELFTLTGEEAGSVCNFRAAYPRSWEFTNFEDFAEQNSNDLIDIPMLVLAAGVCNPDTDTACLGEDIEWPSSSSGAIILAASAIAAT